MRKVGVGGFWAKRLVKNTTAKVPFWDLEVPWERREYHRNVGFWEKVLPETEKVSHSVIF